MSFSPRPRPDTVHLAFSDPDITDTYRDDHSSNAPSSPRVRHPRGDTPLSRRTTATSPGRWSLSRRSTSDAADDRGQDADLRQLSNLDKLLDLLDGHDDGDGADGHGDEWDTAHRNLALSRSVAMSTPPPQPSTSHRPPPAPSTIRKHASSAPRPPPSASSRPAHYGDTVISETVASPLAPPSARSLRPPLSGRTPSAVELLQRANGFGASRTSGSGGIDGAGLPDSPSPRPGSVAALRRSEADRSSASALDASLLRGRERAYGDEAGERTGAAVDGSYEETVASVDSITRVAEAALKEFDTIVSHHSSPGRPASRMRNIPSQPHSATASTFADAAARRPSSPAPPPQQQQHYSQHDDEHAQDVNLQLVQELRAAQDYIAYLQHELHAITDVVHQLREKPEPSPHALEQYPSAPQQRRAGPQVSEQEQVEQTAQAAFEVVKHTLAMLPSLPSSFSPSPAAGRSSPSPGPSLLSLHRALAFTRSVDQLAHRTRAPRRDEDVFAEENLRRVLGVVDEWAARDDARGAR